MASHTHMTSSSHPHSDTPEDPNCAQSPLTTIFNYDDGSDYFSYSPGNPLLTGSESLEKESYNSQRRRRTTWWEYLAMKRRRRNGQEVDSRAGVEGALADSKTHTRKSRRKRSWYNYCIFGGISGLAILAIFLALNLGLIIATSALRDRPDPALALWGAPGTGTEGLNWYPTDFTKDVVPIRCHSHNDYWRQVPLFSAIRAGCTGVESDVWLQNEELFVGHNRASLARNRTFQSLYVNPLVKILEQQNPHSEFYNGSSNGVFDEDWAQTLVLLVDVKTSGVETWPWVLKQLQPLRERGWLTHVENGILVQRPITVVGTGNTPFDLVTKNTTYLDAFFDAPLELMWEPLALPASTEDTPTDDINESLLPNPSTPSIDAGQGMTGITSTSSFTSLNSYYASVPFQKSVGLLWRGKITRKQMKIIRGQIRGAHRRGLKVRYWDLPSWPIGLRNYVWDVLIKEGVDMLNVDDLRAVSKVNW